jgi:glycosyltransferase involved in cell wall biosynthesis
MNKLANYTLLIVGRGIKYSEGEYYMNRSHYKLIKEMSSHFAKATYLCQKYRPSKNTGVTGEKIDRSEIHVQANAKWPKTNRAKKYHSIISDARFVRSISDPIIAYVYYPGFYSFILSPVVFRSAEMSIAHFGSDANDTANAAYQCSIFGRVKKHLYRQLQSYVIDSVDALFATDPRMLNQYEANRIIESKPLIEFTTTDMREPKVSNSDPVTILAVGMFRPVKGYKYLVDAVAQLQAESDRIYHLRLVGDGEQREELESRVETHEIDDTVEFTGFIEDKTKLINEYDSADVFAIPSLKESVPRVLYEATIMGLPVVCTAVGGIPAFVKNERQVLMVEPKDSAALASAIERLSYESELRRNLITNAQEKIDWYLSGSAAEQRINIMTEFLTERDTAT